ncbi:MAG: ATP-binding cassette domain-containing protein, partial [Sphingomonadaceae bacterium]
MSSTITVKDLKLSFGAVDVLKNLNMHVESGEFIVLLGSSGCGKSTLLNCIAGLLEPTDGQLFFDDDNVTWKEPAERGIGMVFQSYALYPQMTVRKNITFGLRNLKLSAQETEARVARVAALLHIENL